MNLASYRVGIDIGGTFTDFVVYEPASGRLTTYKLPSTPDDPARAVLAGLASLSGQRQIVHGSTIATNALLEHKGARSALITTRGFRDVLQIGRQQRPALYDLMADPPAPLVDRAVQALSRDPSVKVRTQAALVLAQRGAREALPARMDAENRIAPEVIAELRRRGHEVSVVGGWGNGKCMGIRYDRERGTIMGGASAKGSIGYAIGW